MKLIRSVREMQQASAAVRCAGRKIALVPTMGALHQGHATLIRAARAKGALVAVSIYVNPTQFGQGEDFQKYPRDLDADCQLCQREFVDVVFAPTDEEMYVGGIWPEDVTLSGQPVVPPPIRGLHYSTFVDETVLSRHLESDTRPGHFRGVCTVVVKLFNIIYPNFAVFGMKDYQQLKVVERITRDLHYPIEIVPVPTVREADGLACSSRNQYLSPMERAQATVLWKALNVAHDLFKGGERNARRLEAAMMRALELAPSARPDYVKIVHPESLEPVGEAQRGSVALVACYIGKTRLIDNLTF
jgi:pantoate--beta-alanine ligase